MNLGATITAEADLVGSHAGCGGDVALIVASDGGSRVCLTCGAKGADVLLPTDSEPPELVRPRRVTSRVTALLPKVCDRCLQPLTAQDEVYGHVCSEAL